MIGKEADRVDHDVADASRLQVPEMIEDIRLEPGIVAAGRSGSGRRAASARARRRRPRRPVGRSRGAVARSRSCRAIESGMLWAVKARWAGADAVAGGDRVEGLADAVGVGGDEVGVVVEDPDLVDRRGASAPTASRARSMSSRYWRQLEYELYAARTRASAVRDPRGGHLRERVGEHGVPVAVSPVDRQGDVRAGRARPGGRRSARGPGR